MPLTLRLRYVEENDAAVSVAKSGDVGNTHGG